MHTLTIHPPPSRRPPPQIRLPHLRRLAEEFCHQWHAAFIIGYSAVHSYFVGDSVKAALSRGVAIAFA